MVKSQNKLAVFSTKANLMGVGIGSKHGDILIGDQAFEFYNSRNTEDYLQIPWDEIKQIRAQIFFNDKYIRGFYIDTNNHGTFNFVVKEAGKTLKTMIPYVGQSNIVRNKTLKSEKPIRKLFRKK